MAALLWVFFFPKAYAPLWGAEESRVTAKQAANAEREQAVKEGILKAKKKVLLAAIESKEEAGMKEGATKMQPEKEFVFFLAEDIRWGGNQGSAFLEIHGGEEALPEGSIDADSGGSSVRWRPEQTLVVMKKKDNPVESPFLQRVVFTEDVAMTKKLELEAPYYALNEIILIFSAPASHTLTQEGAWLSIQFAPSKKAEVPEDMESRARNLPEVPMPAASSPADLLGNLFQAKELYEAFVTGGGRTGELMKKLSAEKRPVAGIFDGRGGFPRDMAPVFKEAYPAFGTKEYWKRHVRAVLGQTFGYSSDFDGTYSSWGGTSCKDGAFTMQPDLDIMYNGLGFGRPFHGRTPPTGSLDFGYKARRMFPMGNFLRFGDGGRLQTINWGANYLPKKNYSLATQNTINLFAGKRTILSGGDWVRDPRRGYRMTNAASFNYRFTKTFLWKNGVGLERTWSNAPEGRSRDATGFLSTGFEQILTRRLRMETGYGYRHIFKDTDPFRALIPLTASPTAKQKQRIFIP